jgi:hypothetical protein
VPDAVVEPDQRAGQQAWIGLRQDALLHPAYEERRPCELEISNSRARECAYLLLARGRPADAEQPLLGDEHAVSEHVLIAQFIGPLQHRQERLDVVLVRVRVAVKVASKGAQPIRHDHVQAVQLRFEIVVQSGRADPDCGGNVGELRRLVAVLAEECGGGPQDLVTLAARRCGGGAGISSGPRARWWGHDPPRGSR